MVTPNNAFQRTPNTPRLFANAFGIVSQKAAPHSMPLNSALEKTMDVLQTIMVVILASLSASFVFLCAMFQLKKLF